VIIKSSVDLAQNAIIARSHSVINSPVMTITDIAVMIATLTISQQQVRSLN
jgi:hypothetical protein